MIRNPGADATKEKTVHVAFYIRVSDDKQAQKTDGSLDTQLDRLEDEIRRKQAQGFDWVMVERLIEGERDGQRHGKSAKNTARPAYQKLLEFARSGMIDVVMVTRLDRISRSVGDFIQLVALLEEHNVKLVSLKENIDLTTPAGRLITMVLMALAQYEREMISARVKDKTAWRAAKGLPLGRSPIGYRIVEKRFVRHEPYDAHVRAAEQLYLRHQSTNVVVKEFGRLGYRSPSGAHYNKSMILRILRSPAYAGKQKYEGQLYDAQWEPLRAWETHEKIQAILDRNERVHRCATHPPKEYAYILQGLLRCGVCGRKMSPRPGTSRNGKRFPYYLCGVAEKSVGVACIQRYVPAQAVDDAIIEFVKTLRLKPERLDAFARHANDRTNETVRKLSADLERVKAQLGVVVPKLRNLVKSIEKDGDASFATMREAMRELETERAELEASQARIKSEIDAERSQALVVQDVLRTLANFEELIEANEGKPDRIKMFLPRFIDYVVWREAKKGEGQLEVAVFQEPLAEPVPVRPAHADGPRFAAGDQMVGRTGFEPVTFCVSSRRSSQLS